MDHPLTKLRNLVDSINSENIVVPKSILNLPGATASSNSKISTKKSVDYDDNTTKNLNKILLETLMQQQPDSDTVAILFKAIKEQKFDDEKDADKLLQVILLQQILNAF